MVLHFLTEDLGGDYKASFS